MSFSEHIDEAFLGLIGKNGIRRSDAAKMLKHYVEMSSREMTLEAFGKFEEDLFQRIFAYVGSGNPLNEKLGGIEAMDALIDVPSSHTEEKVIKFVNRLSNSLKSNTEYEFLVLVARTLGHLARDPTIPNSDYVESELNRGLEWLDIDNPSRKLAGCLVLKELADNAPTLFFTKTHDFLEKIWSALKDNKQIIRETAAKALSTSLQILAQRNTRPQTVKYNKIYKESIDGISRGSSVASIHGSLLAISELLNYTGDFMLPRFKEICQEIMILRDHRDKLIKSSIINLLPRLAQISPNQFARDYLNDCLNYLIAGTKVSESRSVAFLALGEIALVVGNDFKSLVPQVLVPIKEYMSRKSKPFAIEALKCISQLVKAVPHEMFPYMPSLFDAMFSDGLSEVLIDTLRVVAHNLPYYHPLIQEKLRLELSRVLNWKPKKISNPYTELSTDGNKMSTNVRQSVDEDGETDNASHLGGNSSGRETSTSSNKRNGFGHVVSTLFGGSSSASDAKYKELQERNKEAIILALKTMAALRLDEINTLHFVKECAASYLNSKSNDVRKEAARTCIHMLISDPKLVRTVGPSAVIIQDVLTKLLLVAVSDPDPSLRQMLIDSLDERYDSFFRQYYNIDIIFLFLNDERLQIRVSAIKLLGRLTPLNPAYIQPSMRQHLIHLLQQLEFGADVETKEEATFLLNEFLRADSLHSLIIPYLHIFIHVLPLTSNARLTAIALETLGDLAIVVKERLLLYHRQILPIIIDNVMDQSSIHKREIALRTLGKVVSSTGYVIRPYFDYPYLLPCILSILREDSSSMPWSLRREVLRTFGILGALDPHQFQQIQEHLRRTKFKIKDHQTKLKRHEMDAASGDHFGTILGGGSTDSLNTRHTSIYTSDEGDTGPLTSNDKDDEPAHTFMYEMSAMRARPLDSTLSQQGYSNLETNNDLAGSIYNNDGHHRLTPASKGEDYYPTVAIHALMKIFRNSSLSVYHGAVTQAIVFIFKSLGLRCVPFLDLIIPTMVSTARHCEYGLRESIIQELAILTTILKHYLRPFLTEIVDLICEFWNDYQEQVLIFIEKLAHHLQEDFKQHLPRLIPYFLSALGSVKLLQPLSLSGAVHNTPSTASNTVPSSKSGLSANNIEYKASVNTNTSLDSGVRDRSRLNRNINDALLSDLTALQSIERRLDILLHCIVTLKPLILECIHLIIPVIDQLLDDITEFGITLNERNISGDKHLMKYMTARHSSNSASSLHMGNSYDSTNYILSSSGSATANKKGPSNLTSSCHDSMIPMMILCLRALSSLYYQRSSHLPPDGLASKTLHLMVKIIKCGNLGGNSGSSSKDNTLDLSLHAPDRGVSSDNFRTKLSLPLQLREVLMTTICVVIQEVGASSLIFVKMINKAMIQKHIPMHPEFKRVILKLVDEKEIYDVNGLGLLHTTLFDGNVEENYYVHNVSAKSTHAKNMFSLLYDNNGGSDSIGINIHPNGSAIPIKSSKNKHLDATIGNLNLLFPFESNSFDIHSNFGFNTLTNPTSSSANSKHSGVTSSSSTHPQRTQKINQQNLQRAWDVSQRSTSEDWAEWIRRFSLELLRESPSPALRSCSSLAQVYPPLAKELFHAAFVSCWFELRQENQENLVKSLEIAFSSESIPPDILQMLLNLAEFMEHDVEALPIDIRKLATLAQKCHAYAKALHYEELHFQKTPQVCIESLISINKKLGQPEAALGILQFAQKKLRAVILAKESWLAKLGNWSEALELYRQRHRDDPHDINAFLGCMKCLDALGQWDDIMRVCRQSWSILGKSLGASSTFTENSFITSDGKPVSSSLLNSLNSQIAIRSLLYNSNGTLNTGTLPNHANKVSSSDGTTDPQRIEDSTNRIGIENGGNRRGDSTPGSFNPMTNGGNSEGAQFSLTSTTPSNAAILAKMNMNENATNTAPANSGIIGGNDSTNINKSPKLINSKSQITPLHDGLLLLDTMNVNVNALSANQNYNHNSHVSKKVINIAAHASWRLGQWDRMEEFVSYLDEDVVECAFYRGTLAIHNENYDNAALYIDKARKLLDKSFTALVAESYTRAYTAMIHIQQLAEMEEIIDIRKQVQRQIKNSQEQIPTSLGIKELNPFSNIYSNKSSYNLNESYLGTIPTISQQGLDIINGFKDDLVNKWKRRLMGCRTEVSVWQRVIAVRSLILAPRDHIDIWVQFAALCCQSNNFSLAEKILKEKVTHSTSNAGAQSGPNSVQSTIVHNINSILQVNSNCNTFLVRSQVNYAYYKYIWALGRKAEALGSLSELINRISTGNRSSVNRGGRSFNPLNNSNISNNVGNNASSVNSPMDMEIERNLHVRCLLKFGEWNLYILPPGVNLEYSVYKVVSDSCFKATQLDPINYKAWHAWALINFRFAFGSSFADTPHHQLYSGSSLDYNGQEHDPNNVSSNGSIEEPKLYKKNVIIKTSIQGFLEAIALGKKRYAASIQQDMLCLLSILFRYGHEEEIYRTFAAGLGLESYNGSQDLRNASRGLTRNGISEMDLNGNMHDKSDPNTQDFKNNGSPSSLHLRYNVGVLDCWLGVLPQLIARIHTQDHNIRSILTSLLKRLGERHPQALIYPLSVAVKSPKEERKHAAEALMNNLQKVNGTLVEQAILVSHQLIRVAILWYEQWHEGLEDAARYYFGEGNIKMMLQTLLPLHSMIETGATTRREQAFLEAFGDELRNAFDLIQHYTMLANNSIGKNNAFHPGNNMSIGTLNMQRQNHKKAMVSCLTKAWEIYHTVFRKIAKQLPHLTMLDLQSVSPPLMRAQQLDLAVPGTYDVKKKNGVRIDGFFSQISVITSKQRPRRITIKGEDGNDYLFLLKGHEDLRQDERVMQLFGLVNALLAKDRRTNNMNTGGNKDSLSIERYAVTPLSHNVGIVGWVPYCDTLHSLIRDYRESKKVMLSIEHRLMLESTPDYEDLPLLNKVEVFEHALSKTAGQDLYKVLWLKSENSEIWLDRRTNYTRSLAVMSMVGYILGLGDRHPSNLMLDRYTGKILHIDFGDCFEVAMSREKFPEKVPFRLTRMLVNAMEVSGIEGNFRCTCEKVLGVLRDNYETILCMLEAFVHDPLISWRLYSASTDENIEADNSKTVGGQNPTKNGTVQNSKKFNKPDEKDTSGGNSQFTSSNSNQNIDQQKQLAPPPPQSSANGEPLRNENVLHGKEIGTKIQQGAPQESNEDNESQDEAMDQQLAEAFRLSTIEESKSSQDTNTYSRGMLSQSQVTRSSKEKSIVQQIGPEGNNIHCRIAQDVLNKKAMGVIQRVQDKLTGSDFGNYGPLDVSTQVEKLIQQATSTENLCQSFTGWCPFW